MSWLRTIAEVAFALAFVCQPATSSAFVPASPETRVGAFEVVAGTLVGGLGAASRGQQQGIGAAYDEHASGYRFAARGGGEATQGAGRTADRNTDEQSALIDMAKGDKRTGIAQADAQAYKDLGKETGVPVRGPETHPKRPHGKEPHIHVGPVDHIKVRP